MSNEFSTRVTKAGSVVLDCAQCGETAWASKTGVVPNSSKVINELIAQARSHRDSCRKCTPAAILVELNPLMPAGKK